MSVFLRCVVLSLAGFGLTHLLVSLGVALHWARHRPAGPAAVRADALLRLRLIPTLSAAAVLAFAAIGLFRFESREGDEVLGWFFWMAGAFGALLLGVMTWRLFRMQRHTAGLLRAWMSDATPLAITGITMPAFRINTGFPVVAVIGIVRPTLVIDVRVLEACSEEELAAILAHERGHIRRWDNLRRAAFSAVPGPWFSRDLPPSWREATEEAADDLAAASGNDTRFHLATALLRVSRLAPADGATAWRTQLPASALFRGESIERRVRRLVDGPPATERPRRHWTTLTAALLLAAAFVLQRQIHEAMEVVVAVVP